MADRHETTRRSESHRYIVTAEFQDPPEVVYDRSRIADPEAVLSAIRRYGRRLLDELQSLLRDVGAAWQSGRRPWLATLACLLTAGVSGAWHDPQSHEALVKVGDAYAGQPLHVELVRVPASVFLPTIDLPWWAAVIQVAAVLGVAELLLGRPGLTLVGGLAQFASTMLARVMIIYGAAVHIGLPLSQAGILDTGPSGITTAIGAWLLARRHAYATLALLMTALTVAAFVQPNIDGREHETAMFVGIIAAALQARIGAGISISRLRSRRHHEAPNDADRSTC